MRPYNYAGIRAASWSNVVSGTPSAANLQNGLLHRLVFSAAGSTVTDTKGGATTVRSGGTFTADAAGDTLTSPTYFGITTGGQHPARVAVLVCFKATAITSPRGLWGEWNGTTQTSNLELQTAAAGGNYRFRGGASTTAPVNVYVPEANAQIEQRFLLIMNDTAGTAALYRNNVLAQSAIPELLATPAAVRFVSYEPAIGPLNLARVCLQPKRPGSIRAGIHLDALRGRYVESGQPYLGDWDINRPPPEIPPVRLDWVICGGESGPNARPMHPEWARAVRDQCAVAGVPFLFKQWGEWLPGHHYPPELHAADTDPVCSRFDMRDWDDDESVEGDPLDSGDHAVWRVGKRRAGRQLDGRTHDAFPETRG